MIVNGPAPEPSHLQSDWHKALPVLVHLARRAVVFKHTKERDMKVFVWAYVGQCSYSYHSGGGVVVFAETEQRAREIANATPGCTIQESETPEEVRDVSGGGERVFTMPDAGCC